jgi:hypothetical protein
VARNRASASENRIHADDGARRYGFQGGLVPGVTVYGYASHALLEALGPAWLAGGLTRIRFLAPCYDGDTLVVSVQARDLEVIVGERTCVVGCASLPGDGHRGVDVPFIPAAAVPAPDARPPASEEVLTVGQVLGAAFIRKGHRFVVLDVAWLAGDERVAAARHTAIWQLAR